MTTLENRPNAALLVVDVQNGVVSGNYERDAVVANIERIVEKADGNRSPSSGSRIRAGRVPGAAIPGRSSPN